MEILDSKIILDESTTLNGSINGDNKLLKMNFKKPLRLVFDVAVNNEFSNR
jgi:hypothetical protein